MRHAVHVRSHHLYGLSTLSLITPVMLITILILCASLGGCSASRGVSDQDQERCDQLKSYPPQRYLTARGEAQTLREARERAGAKIARRVSAEVRSLIEVSGSTRGDESSERVSEQIEVSTHFKHAELFKPLERCEACVSDSCTTIVALSRDRAAERLIQDMGERLHLMREAAQDLTVEAPLLRFTQAWRQAQSSREQLQPLINQVRALGRDTPGLKQAREMMRRAAEVRARRDELLWVRVSPMLLSSSSIGLTEMASLHEAIDGRFSDALKTLKLKRWSAEECPDQSGAIGPQVITLKPRGELKCNLGYIGPQCQLKLSIHVDVCPSSVLSQDDWSDLKLVGVHPREEARAVDHLVRSVRAADLSEHLSQTLSPFLILDASPE